MLTDNRQALPRGNSVNLKHIVGQPRGPVKRIFSETTVLPAGSSKDMRLFVHEFSFSFDTPLMWR